MSPWHVATKRLALTVLFSAAIAGARNCAERQRYGGTLRVELHAATVALDPREWQVGSAEFAIMLFQIFVTVPRLLIATIAWYIDVGLVPVMIVTSPFGSKRIPPISRPGGPVSSR